MGLNPIQNSISIKPKGIQSIRSKVLEWLKINNNEDLFTSKNRKDLSHLSFIEKQQVANNAKMEMLKMQKQIESIQNELRPKPRKSVQNNLIKPMPPR